MKFTIAMVVILAAAAGTVDALALSTFNQLDAQAQAEMETEFGFGGLADRLKSKVDEAKKKAEKKA